MASNEVYVSSFTGAQIDQAIATYLAGGTAGAATYEIKLSDWKDSTDTSGPKYYMNIKAEGIFNTGVFPKVFIVEADTNRYIEPDVIYGATYGSTDETKGINLTIKSNEKILGTIVWFRIVGVEVSGGGGTTSGTQIVNINGVQVASPWQEDIEYNADNKQSVVSQSLRVDTNLDVSGVTTVKSMTGTTVTASTSLSTPKISTLPAIGDGASKSNNTNIIFGNKAKDTSNTTNSVAIGNNAQVQSEDSVAIGQWAFISATHPKSFQLGHGQISDKDVDGNDIKGNVCFIGGFISSGVDQNLAFANGVIHDVYVFQPKAIAADGKTGAHKLATEAWVLKKKGPTTFTLKNINTYNNTSTQGVLFNRFIDGDGITTLNPSPEFVSALKNGNYAIISDGFTNRTLMIGANHAISNNSIGNHASTEFDDCILVNQDNEYGIGVMTGDTNRREIFNNSSAVVTIYIY